MKYVSRQVSHIEPGKGVTYNGRPATVDTRTGGAYRIVFANGETKVVHRNQIKRRAR